MKGTLKVGITLQFEIMWTHSRVQQLSELIMAYDENIYKNYSDLKEF